MRVETWRGATDCPQREIFCASDDLSEGFAAPAFLLREVLRCEQHVHGFAVHGAENL
jgi:hypothetical protein